jgi:ATP-dependent helicase HrpB
LIQLAIPLDPSLLETIGDREGTWIDSVSWDTSRQQVKAERLLKLGDLILRRTPQSAPSPEQCQALLLRALQETGSLEALPWTAFNQQLRQRLSWMHRHYGQPWPARDTDTLLHDTAWLAASLLGCQSWRDVSSAMLDEALWGDLSWPERQRLDQLLPQRIAIPSGRQAMLRYDDEEVVLPVKLQEMFGGKQGPHVLGGEVPITLELLSPAGRPLQRTRDLEGFWKGSYADVRREMRGRYPKHPWPDDPIQAAPTAFTKRKQQQQQG